MKKLTDEQKLDNKLRRKFENEFRNYHFDFMKNLNNSEYAIREVESNFTFFKFGYLHGARAKK